jgi:hypothetical protein
MTGCEIWSRVLPKSGLESELGRGALQLADTTKPVSSMYLSMPVEIAI